MTPRRTPAWQRLLVLGYRLSGWLLLVVVVGLGALWQHEARGHQVIDAGSPLDEGVVAGFYGRELSDDGRAVTFRWSRPEAELRLRTAPSPTSLQFRALAPPTPDGTPARLDLQLNEQPVGAFALAPTFRVYTVLLPAAPAGEPRVGLRMAPGYLPGDPRALGLVLDWAELRTTERGTPAGILATGSWLLATMPRELVVFPYLPVGLLLVAAAVALAGGRPLVLGLAAGMALELVVALAIVLPGAALALAWSLTVGAGAVALALGVVRVLRLVPALRPDNDRRAVGWLCAVWVITFVLGFAPWVASDGTGYYAYTRSLALDGDLFFANEYREMPFPHTPRGQSAQIVPATGYAFNPFSIGPGLLWLPGFALAHLFVRWGPGSAWPADGYSLPYVTLSTVTTALAGLVLLLAMYRVCRRVVEPPLAVLASVAVFLGTNLFYYTLREVSFAHGLSAAAGALFVLAWLRLEERPSPGRWAAVGAAGGLMALVYWTSVLVLLPAGLSFVRQLVEAVRASRGERRQRLSALALGAGLALLCGLVMVTPQLVAWQIIFGAPLTVPQGAGFITPGAPVAGDFFFSTLRGMLPWTPAYFVGLAGLLLLVARRPWVGGCLALACVVYLLYNMSLPNWHGSGAFGLRRLTALAPWFALGLALVFAALRRAHWGLPVALAALMATWTTLLAWRYDLYLIDRDRGALADMPMAAFLLGRDALPVYRVGDWLGTGFFSSAVGLIRGGMPWTAVLSLVALVALLAAGAVVAAWRIVGHRETSVINLYR